MSSDFPSLAFDRTYAMTIASSVFARARANANDDLETRDASANASSDARALTVFRYEFMSSDVDRTKAARIEVDASGECEVKYRRRAGDGEDDGRFVRFRGRARRRKRRSSAEEDGERANECASEERGIECALIYDANTEAFTLERVGTVIGNLKIAREDVAGVGVGTRERGAGAPRRARERHGEDVDGHRGDDSTCDGRVDARAMFPSSKK